MDTQLHALQKKYIPVALIKIGFVQTHAQSIVFGPGTHGSNRAIDLTIKQGIMIIYKVMWTVQTPGHGQELLRIFLRKFQYVLGLSLLLLEYQKQRAPHLKEYYYVYLCNFLAKHRCQLKFDCVTKPKMEQKNDLTVMDLACDKPRHVLSDANIKKNHYCWSYLQIHRLSYMCTADGSYIWTQSSRVNGVSTKAPQGKTR